MQACKYATWPARLNHHSNKHWCWSESNQTVTDSPAASHKPRQRKNTARHSISRWVPSSPSHHHQGRLALHPDVAQPGLGSTLGLGMLQKQLRGRWVKVWRMLKLNPNIFPGNACLETFGKSAIFKSPSQQSWVYTSFETRSLSKGTEGRSVPFHIQLKLSFEKLLLSHLPWVDYWRWLVKIHSHRREFISRI